MLTDLVGYSALMNQDEEYAIQVLERSTRMQKGLVGKHNGEWIKEMGDGVFVLFDSIVNAIWCGMEIQRTARDDEDLNYKVVIHSAEVTLKDNDLLGDGVNQTARMEELGQANSILVSHKVATELKSIQSIETRYLGDFDLKNIADSMPIYAVVGDGLDIPEVSGGPDKQAASGFDKLINDAVVLQAQEVIQNHIADDKLTVTFLGKQIGLSRPQLYRRVRAATGLSPNEWIREVRLIHAQNLLKTKGLTVSEAAFQSGFNNLSYFSKCFQQRFGLLPSALLSKQASSSPTVRISAAVNDFIGREKELQKVLELLGHTRLLTLTGFGGTGKTRLAMELLRQHGDRFSQGAHFVQLAPVTESDQVLPKLAQVLRIQQDPTKPTLDSIIDFINTRNLLLVLDNFEHVLEASGEISQLLESCPDLRILITSRIVLNIRGETEYSIPQLEVPPVTYSYTPEEAAKYSSISLFINRGKEVTPRFELTEQNVADVVQICRQLDGLPLAIELAATRLKLFTPSDLLRRLTQRIDILKSTSSSVPDRHKTLRSAVDWSYNLLEPAEQTLFRRLSVFSGGFTLEAVEAVCLEGYQDQFDSVDLLSSLVDKSLVHRSDEIDREPRLYMLETIKTFGRERLEKALEKDQITTYLINYYKKWLSEVGPGLTGPDQGQICDQIEIELDNIRSVLNLIHDDQNSELGLELFVTFWRYWTIRSMMREGRSWAQRLLELPTDNKNTISRINTLSACGIMLGLTQYVKESYELLQESLTISRKLNYEEGIGESLNHLGWISFLRGNHDEVEKLSKEAIEINQRLKNLRAVSVGYNNLGWSHRQRGQLTKAKELSNKAGVLRKSIGDVRGYAFNTINEAYVDVLMGNYDTALTGIDSALKILEEIGDGQLQAWVFTIRAYCHYMQGDLDLSLQYTNRSLPMWEQCGNYYGLGLANWLTAKTKLAKNELNDVEELVQKIIESSNTSALWFRYRAKSVLAELEKIRGNHNCAIEICVENLHDIMDNGALLFLPNNLELLSSLYFANGREADAAVLYSWSQGFRKRHKITTPKIAQEGMIELEHKLVESGINTDLNQMEQRTLQDIRKLVSAGA